MRKLVQILLFTLLIISFSGNVYATSPVTSKDQAFFGKRTVTGREYELHDRVIKSKITINNKFNDREASW